MAVPTIASSSTFLSSHGISSTLDFVSPLAPSQHPSTKLISETVKAVASKLKENAKISNEENHFIQFWIDNWPVAGPISGIVFIVITSLGIYAGILKLKVRSLYRTRVIENGTRNNLNLQLQEMIQADEDETLFNATEQPEQPELNEAKGCREEKATSSKEKKFFCPFSSCQHPGFVNDGACLKNHLMKYHGGSYDPLD